MAEQSALDFRFDGKRAVVTGAGKGIGYDACIALAKAGAQVIAVSRTQADLDKLLAEVGERITPVFVDISDVAATKKVLGEVGDIDLVVNNGKSQTLFFS
jgi:L-xylulose reductase